jgi:uncharacterized protein YyaL (SSP411 family)
MTNRLAQESSPYLLQHAENPVDWYAWGPEALERAKREDKPIFLSIGYSACHWCHVMEHESFENPQIAALMNQHYVCIKVDREERPDLDQVYMQAVQMMTGRGGWPMSVFLTPDLRPFYGGTYWPPTARSGLPGFDQVLSGVAEAWQNRKPQVFEQASSLVENMQQAALPAPATGRVSARLLHGAAAALERIFDYEHGGFGQAPKFPHPMDVQLLLRVWRRTGRGGILDMVKLTLDKMAGGGIYDHLAGGFHRYSVDEHWLVPHFEKMLYDNALLTSTYLDAFLATGSADYARVARETCDYVLREMTDPAGGFYSTQDADSEGEEGKFFLWSPAETAAALGAERARTFNYVYDVTDEGNFEGRNILNHPKTLAQCAALLHREPAELNAELAESRAALLAVRRQRIAPGLDDKVLVSWNGLMLDALAKAAGVLDEPRYLKAATAAAEFLTTALRRPDGRLLHAWRHGKARFDAYLDDYACLANGLVSLYEAGFDERWLRAAVQSADQMLQWFSDPKDGGFFYTSSDHEKLVARQKDLYDNATPSGNGMAVTALVRLGKLTGRADYLQAVDATLQTALGVLERSPTAAGQMLLAYDMLLGPTQEIAILGDPAHADTAAVLAELRHRYWPNKLLALRPSSAAGSAIGATSPEDPLASLFAGKQATGPEPTVFVCENFACQAPVAGKEAAIELLRRKAVPPAG